MIACDCMITTDCMSEWSVECDCVAHALCNTDLEAERFSAGQYLPIHKIRVCARESHKKTRTALRTKPTAFSVVMFEST